MTEVDTWLRNVLDGAPAVGTDLPGLPGVLPLWNGDGIVAGLLALPEVEPRSWPGVSVADGHCLTVASDARTLLPQLLVQQLSNDPDAVRQVAVHRAERGTALRELHELLGGATETLDLVFTVAADPERLDTFTYSGDDAAFERVHSEICRQIDRSGPFRRYADWLDAAIHGNLSPPGAPDRYGAWGRRVLCWHNRLSSGGSRAAAGDLVPVVEGFAGLDSGVPVDPTWSVEPGGASPEAALVQAAFTLEQFLPLDDPVSDGIVRALVEEGTGYRGSAHAEAGVALDERGEPSRAWGAFQSAVWWATQNLDPIPEVFGRGGRILAGRRRWTDILTVLDRH